MVLLVTQTVQTCFPARKTMLFLPLSLQTWALEMTTQSALRGPDTKNSSERAFPDDKWAL